MTLFEELKRRGLIAQMTNEEKIRELLDNEKGVPFYRNKSIEETFKLVTVDFTPFVFWFIWILRVRIGRIVREY